MRYLDATTLWLNIWGDVIKDGSGLTDEEAQAREDDLPPATILTAIKNCLNQMRAVLPKPMLVDDENALEIARAIRTAENGYIAIEEAPYKWLLKFVEEHGPKLLSPNTRIALDLLEGALSKAQYEEAVKRVSVTGQGTAPEAIPVGAGG